MNLENGMNLEGINFDKLGKFLLSCKKAGVESLKLGLLEVKFKESVSAPSQAPLISEAGQPIGEFTTEQTASVEQGAPSASMTLLDKSEILEMESAQRLIDDPAGYEQSMIDAHLETQRVRGDA